jgi:hypothetical protein
MPNVQDSRTEILSSVAEGWNRSGIGYAVANGLESYPHRLGRDIDVVVDPEHMAEAGEIIHSVLSARGWRIGVRKRAELAQHIGICPRTGEALIIDLFSGLRWGPTWLVERVSPGNSLDVFRRDPWVSFVKRVLLHVLVAPALKFSNHPERLRLTEEERLTASKRLPELVGHALASRLLIAIDNQDVTALGTLRSRLRSALVSRTVRNQPLRFLRTTRQWAGTRLAIASSSPIMPIVSIVGPDGVGKSSVLAEVVHQAQERLRCPKVETRHWRPGVLPSLGFFLGRPAHTAATPPRRTAGRFGLLRTLYYSVDFLAGYYLRDRRVSQDLGLVLYDRGVLDMYVDPLRYGLASGRTLRLLSRFLPRPDLVVLLYDEPGRIRARKAELEEDEIRRQLDAWMLLADAGEVNMVVQVDDSPARLASRIVDRLADLFLSRIADRDDENGRSESSPAVRPHEAKIAAQ